MKTRPKILITNDDGVYAPGIMHLWQSLKDIADVAIVAPASEQSAVSLSITLRQPLRIERVNCFEGEANSWSITGTPADCVKLALKVILDWEPDLIVSGINRGTNAGRNVLYSGTVAGVIEGVMHDIPGVAFSCHDYQDPHYSVAAQYIPNIVQHILEHPLSKGTLLNVNFPKKLLGNIKGVKMTRQGMEYWAENPDERSHPTENHSYYWLGAALRQFEEHEESDIAWLRQGYIAAVPVHVRELTDYREFAQRKTLFEQRFI